MGIKFPPIPSDAAKDFQGKIVIIGAGVAGLFAANTLKFIGVENYVILEASDRIGGRLKYCEDLHNEVPLELGAEWIHAPNAKMVEDMLLFPPDDPFPSEDFIKYKPEFTLKSGKKSKLMHWLYQETKWKKSTWWHWLHEHVYSHVKEKVKLNSPVKEIVYGSSASESSEVKVIMADGFEYKAEKVICTVPLAILKKGDDTLKWTPPLPKKTRQAIDAIIMPPGFRILFEMKSKFYPDLRLCEDLLKWIPNLNDLGIFYDPLYGKELTTSQHILAFVAIGYKNAGEMSQMNEEDLVKAVLAKMDDLFDGQGSQNYVSHRVQNWTLEPYIQGAYTFPGPRKYRRELGKTLEHQIFFAGEHTSLNYFSLVPGAAMEGRRAALEAVTNPKI